MTSAQKEIYDAIVSFIQSNGYSPTVREIAAQTGQASSLGNTFRKLQVLREAGHITWEDGKLRTIRVLR